MRIATDESPHPADGTIAHSLRASRRGGLRIPRALFRHGGPIALFVRIQYRRLLRGSPPSSHKKRITASLGFRSAEAASRTIEGYEAMHAIRKGQIRWLDKGDVVGQRQFIQALFGIAA